MKPPDFSAHFSGLPPEVSSELEDHLTELVEAGIRDGLTEEDARIRALQAFGPLQDIGQQCVHASNPNPPTRMSTHLQQHAVVFGWLLLAIGFATRVCAAPNPSFGSIATCISLSLISLTLSLLLRRATRPTWRWGVFGSSVLFLTSASALLTAQWHPWIHDHFALSPQILTSLGLFAGWSGGTLISELRQDARIHKPQTTTPLAHEIKSTP